MRRLLRKEHISWEDIPGLIWRDNGSIHANPRTMIGDLDNLKFPAWDLMPPASYPDSPREAFTGTSLSLPSPPHAVVHIHAPSAEAGLIWDTNYA